LEEFRTDDENVLGLRANIYGSEVLLVSVYGPNSNDAEFYENLSDLLHLNEEVPIVMGGDWNCLYSTYPVDSNMDCINMTRTPNQNNSLKLNELSEMYSLTDPFRFLYPDKIEFSYVPRNILSNNRSRLDFFLVSDSILGDVYESTISQTLQNKLFDHKVINVTFNRPVTSTPVTPSISNKELGDDLLEYVVKSTVAETYLQNCTDREANVINANFLLNVCGTIKQLVRDCGPPLEFCIGENQDLDHDERRNRKITRLQILCNSLNIPVLENVELNCNPAVFMETLLNNIKIETISHQIFIRKCKKNKLNSMTNRLRNLKKDYVNNIVHINELEKELNTLLDIDMRSELERYRHFDILNVEKMSPRFLSIVKQAKKFDSLDCIQQPDGTAFASSAARETYIREYYQDIYRDKSGDHNLPVNCIEEFISGSQYL
jgi:hypothetical protein